MFVIHTVDSQMRKILEMAGNVASSRASVLISGESGCGKELLARYIHAQSPRAMKKFVAINCAAVPEGLLESELFGYEKGAFTGADSRKIGKFELANESTFLLDEISEMPLLLQAKLLRVLQEGEIERLGSTVTQKINVRVIATTNRKMSELVARGEFREDLYYRLNVVPIEVPALRTRKGDIEMLARLFLEISCAENQMAAKEFSTSAMSKMLQWKWPGNVRELQNVVERSALLSAGSTLMAEDIRIENFQPTTTPSLLQAGMKVSEAEKVLIINTLEAVKNNRTRAAELLGISIRTLRNKINEYRLEGVANL